MNNVPWETEETVQSYLLLHLLHFLVSFNATVAGNGCDDKDEADAQNKRITVPKTTWSSVIEVFKHFALWEVCLCVFVL